MALALEGCAIPTIAERVGAHRSTVWAWLQEPEAAAELSRHRSERRAVVASELDVGAIESVTLLRRVVNDETAPIGARIRAAGEVLDRAGLTPTFAVELRKAEAETAETTDETHAMLDYSSLTDAEMATLSDLMERATPPTPENAERRDRLRGVSTTLRERVERVERT